MDSSALRETDLLPSAPEYAVIPLSFVATGARRLEGESYLTGGYAIRRRIEALASAWRPLVDLARVWQPPRLAGIATRREHGVPFLTATQVFDTRPIARKWLVKERTKNYSERLVEPGWILLTCSGSVGEAMISYEPHAGHIVSHDLLRVQPYDDARRGYIYTFLRTKYGRAMMKASQYGSIIKHLEPEHVQGIPVLEDDAATYRHCRQAMSEVFRFRGEAFSRGMAAEDLFGRIVGDRKEPASDEGFEVTARSLFSGARRLDAYNHNPTAASASEVLWKSGHRMQALSDAAIVSGVPRFKHLYAPEGIPYLDSEDLIKINPEVTKYLPVTTKMRRPERYYVKAGWLLMVCSGQIYGINGSVLEAMPSHEGRMISNHVLRIVPKLGEIRPGYLQVALGHPELGRPLVLRCAFGTEVPELGEAEVGALPLVRLEESQEDAIADLAEGASVLRMKADKLENAVVARLEARISKRLAGTEGDSPEVMFSRLQQVARGLLQVPKGELDAKVAEARSESRKRRKSRTR
jgi:type I restriction enzyme, S subunit